MRIGDYKVLISSELVDGLYEVKVVGDLVSGIIVGDKLLVPEYIDRVVINYNDLEYNLVDYQDLVLKRKP